MAVRIRSAVSAEFDITIDAVLLLKPRTLPRTTSGKLRRNAARVSFESKVRAYYYAYTVLCMMLHSVLYYLYYYHLFSSSPFFPSSLSSHPLRASH